MKLSFHKIIIFLVLFSFNRVSGQTITVNGQMMQSEGYTLYALQNNYTQFGDNQEGNVMTATIGSELDGAYAKVANGTLYLMLTGNLESNYNKIELFFDYKSGGQNQLLSNNPMPSEFEDPNKMAGLTFDAGFEADFWMAITNGPETGTPKIAVYAAAIETGGNPNGFVDVPVPDITMSANGGPYAWTYLGGYIGLNNSNIAGVGGSPGEIGPPDFDPATVSTGVEMAIPLAYIGNPTGDIKISAFINSSGHDYLSNQVLGGLGANINNLAKPDTVNFNDYAGNQYFTVSQTNDIEPAFGYGNLNIFPSPTANTANINLYLNVLKSETAQISIFNVEGVLLEVVTAEACQGANQWKLDLQNYAEGVYAVTIKNGDLYQTEKIILLKN